MTTTNTRFTHKTLAIALAAGMSLGSVTVPQIAAVDGVAAVASAESGNVPAQGYVNLYFTPTITARGLVNKSTNTKLIVNYGKPGASVDYNIPAGTLNAAGIDPTKEFTVIGDSFNTLVGVSTKHGSTGEGFKFTDSTTLTIDAGTSPDGIGLTVNAGNKNQGTVATIKQGDNVLNVYRESPHLRFHALYSAVVKPGSQVQTRKPMSYPEDDGRVRFSIENKVRGANVDPTTGVLTYTPPKDFAGGYVEIDVKATIDKASLGNRYVSGDPYTATATYRFYVEPQPQSDLHVTVKDNKDGTYTLSKNDGSSVTIKTKDGVQSVTQSGNTITFTMADGTEKTVKVTPDNPVTITDNKNGTATISDGKTKVTVPTQDLRVTDVKKLANGDYEVIRSDGQKWTIKQADLLKRVSDLEGKDSPTRSEYDALVKDLQEAKDGIDGLKGKDAETDAAIKKLKDGLDGLDGRVSGLEGRVTDVENATIKQVIKNADGTYTLVRVDGTKVPSNIDPRSGSVTNVKSDGKGNLVITIDGKDKTVPLEQVKVTEANKGKPNHTITITTPGGKPLTFNVYDNYVTEIKDLGDGKYTLVRKDGTQVEGTIDTTDGSITKVKSDGKGNLVVTIDGKDQTVPLDKVKITESNKGTPDHTVTIAVPGGKTVTFGVFDRHIDNVAKQGRGKYIVERNDGRNWTIDYSDLYDVADDLTAKVADHEKRIKALEAHDKVQDAKIAGLRKDVDRHTKELERVNTEIRDITKTIEDNKAGADDKFKKVNERIDKVRTDLGLLEVRVTSLEGRMALVEGRLDGVEDVQDKWAKCYSGAGIAALPVALSIPLYVLSQTHIPQVEVMNANIQKQIGVFNPQLAAVWRQQGGILQVTAALAGLAGTIGAIAYAANECKPYSETDAASKTPLGQMSSKVYAGSSRGDDAAPAETAAE